MTDDGQNRRRVSRTSDRARKEHIEKIRKTRKPLGQLQKNLEASLPEGYAGEWVNNDPGNLERKQLRGWSFVSQSDEDDYTVVDENVDIGSVVSKQVGTLKDGSPMRAYLMVLPVELKAEDDAELQKPLDKIDREIMGGRASAELEEAPIPEGRRPKISASIGLVGKPNQPE